MKPFFVYMLRCGDGTYYVGHTDDLESRVFGELPDMWVAAGSAIIVGSGLFILWREKVVRAKPPGPG